MKATGQAKGAHPWMDTRLEIIKPKAES